MEQFEMVAPCLLGVEGLVGEELRDMEAAEVRPENGRVFFKGDEQMLARANMGSRYSERILIHLGTFPARTFEELFQGVKSLSWERWIDKADAFPVKGRSLNSKLHSVPDCQSIIKKAVVERLKSKYRVSWFEETGPIHQIQFLLMKDQASLMLDTSGVGLHKRGYRQNSTEAPIKETLAAAMVKLARVRSDGHFIDPFCGSGTLLTEAALYALGIAPGLQRRFSAEKWGQVDSKVWQEERLRARDLVKRDAAFQAEGYDIDPAAVALSLENAKKAGVIARVKARVQDIRDFRPEGEYGCVICNPPYGERLLDIQSAQELYRVMGKVFVPQHGWSYSIISPDETFEDCYGRRADKRRKLYNGMIKCQYYQYFTYPRKGKTE